MLVLVACVLVACASRRYSEIKESSKPKSLSFNDKLNALWHDFDVPEEVQKRVKQAPKEISGVRCISSGGPTFNVPEAFTNLECKGYLPEADAAECKARGIAALLHAVDQKREKHYSLDLICKGNGVNVSWNIQHYNPEYFRIAWLGEDGNPAETGIYWTPIE